MPLARLKRKITKEILWIYLLNLLKEREMYAYEIRKELERKFGFKPALITSYVVLYRLEREGYVKSRGEEKKRYYMITTEGEELLKKGTAYIEEMLEKLKS